MKIIDLSCDLGEAESPEARQQEVEIWPLITSANVACGGHAGDRDAMEMAVRRCLEHNVALGAHPSYPDRLHFGRSRVSITDEALRECLIEQMSELRDIARENGVRMTHVKPHGALYNEARHDSRTAELLIEAVRAVDQGLAVVAAPGSKLLHAAGRSGVPEGFGDRRYLEDGSLVPRTVDGALILDFGQAAEQAEALARTGMYATLCVHGDMAGAAERLRAIRARLEQSGFTISAAARRPNAA
jgi:5-oxoprolinase (ATP-hydrolysing) subunit A